ncbi:ethanolamine utilization protein EutJ [uncultured Megasphaera sp.]|uniref:ethanolamine utilization protein EutJ n=1 Tax=uncultured Megasphaera sp. TaxID=165188 RepID=UPI00265892E4|nr:ethanolamine utilization protein EutJ [uncultured Megasphaera sp.]
MLMDNTVLADFAALVASGETRPFEGPLKVGVDLGTANIVLAVTDSENRPVAGMTTASKVVRDGIVVDYVGAVRAVRQMKAALEEKLGVELTQAATAIPPGILEGNVRCIANCVEGADLEVTRVIDEPTAASTILNISDGAVVDVGGGTTGISILKDGNVTFTADEATGGTHMSLVLAGYYGISFDEAETLKKDTTKESDVFPVVKPVVEKMASIVQRFVAGKDVQNIYVVGGACCFTEFEDVFEKILHIPTWKPNDCLFVTPLGIAVNQ